MVLLGAKSITVEDVTVFPDHADPNQFWYLPGPVALAKRTDNQSAFTFIKYKPAVVQSGVKGGGFCMFDVSLHLDQSVEQRIRGKLSELGSGTGTPTLSPVQFDSGTVKCVALNLEGSDGTKASPAPPGAFNAVEEIQGASIPSLSGDEDAIFSLTLSQEGSTILQQAFEQGTGPIGVIYDLKYTGIRPALKVKITADFKRIYQSLSISLSAQYYFLKVGLDAEFEKLVQDGSIKIEVIDFTSDADAKQKEQWALDFFKDKLLNDWFEPTLKPGEIEGGAVSTSLPGASGGTQKGSPGAGQAGNQGSQGSQGSQGGQGSQGSQGSSKQGAGGGSQQSSSGGQPGGQATGAGAGGQQASASGSQGSSGSSAGAATAAATATKPAPAPTPAPSPLPATLTQAWTPNPPPAGYRLDFTPATSGTTETITVSGSNPTVKVDNLVRNLDSNHRITVDVAPGSSHTIDVDYPSAPATNQTFSLLFDFEEPQETWVAGNPGTNANYQSYLADKPSPADSQFSHSTAPNSTTATGAAALRKWIATLADPKSVAISAHASFEGDATSSKQAYNTRLSGRRADVARGIIGTLATISATEATGQTEAMNAGRLRDANDRVARVTGMTAAGTPQTSVHATISRPPTPSAPQGGQPQGQPQGGQPQGGQPQGGQPQGGQPQQNQQQSSDGSPAIAFKLRFVDQDEQKTMVFEYSRQDAVQRTYAPQGLFGLMLTDLNDEDKHFVEVDLDDPFFRVFEVTIDAPVDFKSIGLISAHVSIDYGDPADATNFKHGDFLFDAQNHAQQKFQVFMDAARDTSYTYTVEYHFDPESGWDGTKLTYQLPPKTTTDRSLSIDPHDQIGFLQVNVIAHEIDWGAIDSVDAHLSQALKAGPIQQKTVTLSHDLQSQFWRVRVDAPGPAEYTFSCTHHLKDGTTRDTAPATSRASVLPINDPFESAIEIDFIPLLDPTRTRMAFIDIAYDDPDNHYHREERLTLTSTAKDAIHERISLMNPALKTYQYRITSVGTNNQMQRGDFVFTTETLIGVF